MTTAGLVVALLRTVTTLRPHVIAGCAPEPLLIAAWIVRRQRDNVVVVTAGAGGLRLLRELRVRIVGHSAIEILVRQRRSFKAVLQLIDASHRPRDIVRRGPGRLIRAYSQPRCLAQGVGR